LFLLCFLVHLTRGANNVKNINLTTLHPINAHCSSSSPPRFFPNTTEEAARAYDAAARHIRGPNARTNFQLAPGEVPPPFVLPDPPASRGRGKGVDGPPGDGGPGGGPGGAGAPGTSARPPHVTKVGLYKFANPVESAPGFNP
jgi:hypothetical protein